MCWYVCLRSRCVLGHSSLIGVASRPSHWSVMLNSPRDVLVQFVSNVHVYKLVVRVYWCHGVCVYAGLFGDRLASVIRLVVILPAVFSRLPCLHCAILSQLNSMSWIWCFFLSSNLSHLVLLGWILLRSKPDAGCWFRLFNFVSPTLFLCCVFFHEIICLPMNSHNVSFVCSFFVILFFPSLFRLDCYSDVLVFAIEPIFFPAGFSVQLSMGSTLLIWWCSLPVAITLSVSYHSNVSVVVVGMI